MARAPGALGPVSPAPDGQLKDTLPAWNMEQYEIEFVANNPGVWLFHCHNLEHVGGGLMAEIHYR